MLRQALWQMNHPYGAGYGVPPTEVIVVGGQRPFHQGPLTTAAAMLGIQDIGMYKINHMISRWVICTHNYCVPNVFNGHAHWTEGPFDWHRSYERMLTPGLSAFHLNFTLPWCIMSPANEVFLSFTCFTGQMMPPCHCDIYINGHLLLRRATVMNENHGMTVLNALIPHYMLHLHMSGRPNHITVRFTEGMGHIFMQSFKISAKLPPRE